MSRTVKSVKAECIGQYKTYEVWNAGFMNSRNPNLIRLDDFPGDDEEVVWYEIMDHQDYRQKVMNRNRIGSDMEVDSEFPCLVIYTKHKDIVMTEEDTVEPVEESNVVMYGVEMEPPDFDDDRNNQTVDIYGSMILNPIDEE